MYAMDKIFKKVQDKDFRAKLTTNPKKHLAEIYGGEYADAEYVVVTCTKDITYIAMPSSDQALNTEQLSAINAAGTVGSASSAGTVGSFLSTVSSAGTVGTAGSANVNVNNDIRS